MAKVVGDIVVRIGADIGSLQGELAKGGKSVRKFGKDFEKTADRMAVMARRVTIAVAAISVVGAALGSAAKAVMDNAREIDNLARVAGVGVERFQSLAFAAREVGVEQEKLSDILKDVNDKIGDFMQTGAGPMADFFEQIAPRVGVTADQFRRLNSADALALYVETLERANVSQAEMTFYMEAIASDAMRLAPLLRNNAAALGEMEQSARDLGVVLDENLIKRSVRMATIWGRMVDAMKGHFMSFASQVLIGFDHIFGITEQGQISNMTEKIHKLHGERGEADAELANLSNRDGRPMMFSGSPRIVLLKEVIAAADEEITGLQEGIMELQRAVERRAALTAALEGGFGGGTGDRLSDDKSREAREASLERLRERFMTQQELIEKDYQAQLALLDGFLSAKEIKESEYRSLRERLEAEHAQRTKSLEQSRRSATLYALSGMFGDLSSLMRTENDKLFKIGKAAAKAEAIVSGYLAAVGAWEKGMKIGGPPVAAAFTAASLAKTGALISSIGSTSIGSGGAAPAGGGAASVAAAPRPLSATLNLTGPLSDVLSGSIGSLLDQLNAEAGDRGYHLTVAAV